ncbi:MAG: hypothetical protein IPM12_14780 [Flavobacteriales bacterium]|nr:hypothetical protein [Flavobacteriales bacterium]
MKALLATMAGLVALAMALFPSEPEERNKHGIAAVREAPPSNTCADERRHALRLLRNPLAEWCEIADRHRCVHMDTLPMQPQDLVLFASIGESPFARLRIPEAFLDGSTDGYRPWMHGSDRIIWPTFQQEDSIRTDSTAPAGEAPLDSAAALRHSLYLSPSTVPAFDWERWVQRNFDPHGIFDAAPVDSAARDTIPSTTKRYPMEQAPPFHK